MSKYTLIGKFDILTSIVEELKGKELSEVKKVLPHVPDSILLTFAKPDKKKVKKEEK